MKDDGGTLYSGIDTSKISTFYMRVTAAVGTPSFKLGGSIRVLENAGLIRLSSFAGDVITSWSDSKGYQFETFAEQTQMFAVQPYCTLMCRTQRECTGHLNFQTSLNVNGNTTIWIRLTEVDPRRPENATGITDWRSVVIIIMKVNQPPDFEILNNTVRTYLGETSGPTSMARSPIPLKEDDGCLSLDYFATRISPGPETDANGTSCLLPDGLGVIYRTDALGCDEGNQTMTFVVLPAYDGTHNVTLSTPILLVNGTLQFCINEKICGGGVIECSSTFLVFLTDDGQTSNTSIVRTFSIVVQAVNHPPAFDLYPSISVEEVESSTQHVFPSQIENITKGGADEDYQNLYFKTQLLSVTPASSNDLLYGLKIS
jgi:hypothetical protein